MILFVVGIVLLALVIVSQNATLSTALGGLLGTSIPQSLIESFAQGIATAEGFYVSGSIPQQANNPGDIADNGVTQWTGDSGQRITSANGASIIVFNSVQDGWNALYQLVTTILSGSGSYNSAWTLAQVGEHYANDAGQWAENVAEALGVSTSTTVAQLVASATGSQSA
jgi:hypothetical protein